LAVVGIVVIALGIGLFNSLYTVHQTQQALVLQFGDPKRVVKEAGLKLKIPFVQNVVFFDRRLLGFDPPKEEVILADRRRLEVDAFIRYQIKDPLRFYQTVRNELGVRSRLQTLVGAGIRRVLAKVPLDSVLSERRAAIMLRIRDQVNQESQRLGVEIIDLRIVRADLPAENTQAILRRMQTERARIARRIRAEGEKLSKQIKAEADRDRTILLSEAEKQAQILRGEGDGEKTQLLNQAYGKDKKFFSLYRSMEAYREALDEDTTLVLSPDSDFFRFFGDMEGRRRK
jgi:membrane protease subunit HflC